MADNAPPKSVTSGEYAPPAWGVDGANAFAIFLEVIKGGVVLEQQALPVTPGRSFVVVGRLPPPTCDLELAHASASRVHAALQFDAQGALFLCDLGSTHGSFVNKARVPAHEFVRLHIGDVLAFGESSRLYAVCGPAELLPAEYDSLNVRAFRAKSLQRQQEKAAQRKRAERATRATPGEDDGASWGFREDAVEDDDDDGNDATKRQEGSDSDDEKLPDYLRNLKREDTPYTSSVSADDVSEKDQKLFAQLQARVRKLANLQLESTRIQAKQHQLPGLSAGQEATLARNEQRVTALRKDIADLEGRIHAKNAQRAQTASGRQQRQQQQPSARADDDDDTSDNDDFYDRTASNQRKQQARRQELGDGGAVAVSAADTSHPTQPTVARDGVLTAASIQATIRTLESELVELVREHEAAQVHEHPQQQQEEAGGEVDSLDAFMASTTQALHATQLATVASRRQAVEAELRRQQQLLVVATPALARVPTPMRTEAVASTRLQQQSGAVESNTTDDRADVMAAREQQLQAGAAAPTASNTTADKANDRADDTAVDRAVGPTGDTTRDTTGDTTRDTTGDTTVDTASSAPLSAPALTNRPVEPPTIATVAPQRVMDTQSSASSAAKKRRVVGPALGPSSARTTKATRKRTAAAVGIAATIVEGESSVLEGGERVWVPPTGQTGDGRTTLNDKFGY